MKQTSTISVIIPIKNRASLIGETLDSIIAQTYSAYEIIIVDDGSTDDLIQALAPYKENVLLVASVGKGPGAARNTGLKYATGDFIQFFDSDDIMSINKLKEQATLLIQNPDKDIVLGPYVMAKKENNAWVQTDVIMQYNAPTRHLNRIVAEGWCSITQACLFTRKIIDNVGPWREDLMTHEDLEYWYRLSMYCKKPLHENRSITIYRQHEKQITDALTTNLEKTLNGIKAFQAVEKLSALNPVSLWSKMILKGHIANHKKYYNRNNPTFKLRISDYINAWIAKLAFKFGQLKTGTAWQPDHGVHTNKNTFYMYTSQLHKVKSS